MDALSRANAAGSRLRQLTALAEGQRFTAAFAAAAGSRLEPHE